MRRKTVWLGLLAAAVAVLSTGLATAAPTTGERALSAGEMGGTFGACCKDDYLDKDECSTNKGWSCFSCLRSGSGECGLSKEYSGNEIRKCLEGTGGVCKFVQNVNCSRLIPCNSNTPWFKDCLVAGGPCRTIPLPLTLCIECTPGMPGPWTTRGVYICDK